MSDSLRPLDCSLPGPFVHGILQARILEWVAMPSSRGSSQPRDQTHISCVSCIGGEFFTIEPPEYSSSNQKAQEVQKRMGVNEILLSTVSILLPNSDMSSTFHVKKCLQIHTMYTLYILNAGSFKNEWTNKRT